MNQFRISKYDPKLRNNNGSYNRHEWTSFSDIGQTFYDGVLTLHRYQDVEAKYIDALIQFFSVARTPNLRIESIEVFSQSPIPKELCNHQISLEEGKRVDLHDIPCITRLCLRELAWVKLSGPNDAYLHFGYDCYVYVGAQGVDIKQWHAPEGLFAEACASPYAV
jgi:hypothetical protein